MNDIKIFLMYIFNPKGLIEGFKEGFEKMLKPKIMSTILISIALLSLFIFPKPKNYFITFILLVLSFIIQLRIAYIGGDHRYWYKQKLERETWQNNSAEQN